MCAVGHSGRPRHEVRLLHVADLHLGAPDQATDATGHKCSREWRRDIELLRAIVGFASLRKVDLLVVAGDLLDARWHRRLSRDALIDDLQRVLAAPLRSIVALGNHDPDDEGGSLLRQAGVSVLSSIRAETIILDALHIAVHGRSFRTRFEHANFAAEYPERQPNYLNVGVLHTAVRDLRDDPACAPCDLRDLRERQYSYWALGHEHRQTLVSREPWIIYPGRTHLSAAGNGAGGSLVTIRDGRIAAVELF
ncbi:MULTISPECIES: exonuclease SbcCD subunit D [unclassified Bradyrhizobium]|nr:MULTISPECIES: metallophosphoesterase [unclassified Bradyrhizobium]